MPRMFKSATVFQDLSGAVQALVSEISKGQKNLESLIKAVSDRQKNLQDLVKTGAIETQTRVIQRVDELDLSWANLAQHDKILQSLKAPKLNSRRTKIEPPHASTLAWIFQPELPEQKSKYAAQPPQMRPNPFLRWCLEGKAKIFWVNGKAGSGKSILMKHLVDSQETQRLLDSTSPNSLILSHFLWGGGTSEERSVKNILCSLLHQILSSEPQVVASISTRYSTPKDEPDDWSPHELQDSIIETVNILNRPVCIFIDGLDEIGDHDADRLLMLIDLLLADRHIRLCVSSRPNPAFHKRFGEGKVRSLRVQDSTWSDIRGVVEDTITKTFGARDLGTELSDTIFQKANGVFLWVSLALRAITRGSIRDEDHGELMRRLEALPGDLGKLYQQMWDRENGDSECYRRDAALWLNLMLESEDIVLGFRLTVWHCLLVRKTEYLDKIFNNSRPVEQLEAISLELPEAKRQLEIRCAGLLEVREQEGRHHLVVSFIHRSAKEFLVNSNNSILRFDQTTPDFRKFALLTCSIVIPSNGKMDQTTVLSKSQPTKILPDYSEYCVHLQKLRLRGRLDAETTVKLLKYTKKMYDQTDQMHLRCDFDAMAASLGMWEYILPLTEGFRAKALGGKVPTAYSNYLFSASFGIPGKHYYSTHENTEEGKMKVACRMLENGISLHDKSVGSRFFSSRTSQAGKPRLAVIASSPMLATIRLIQHMGDVEDIHPALEDLASIVRSGAALDEKTVIKLQFVREGSTDEFTIATIDTPEEDLPVRLNGVCFIEVNTIFLLRLLLTVAASFFNEGTAATDQMLILAHTTELRQERRDGDIKKGGSSGIYYLKKDELQAIGLGHWDVQDETDENAGADYVEAAKDNVQAAAQTLVNLASAIRQESDGLQPFSALMAFGFENAENLDLGTLTLRDREYLSDGLQEAYPEGHVITNQEVAAKFKFPLLHARLQDIVARVKWESITEFELYERLKLVENGYFVHPDDEICMVPKPF